MKKEKSEKACTRETQCRRLLVHMQNNESVTCLDGFQLLGIVSFPRRILDLKRQGFTIADKWITVKNRYGEECRVKEYRLVG